MAQQWTIYAAIICCSIYFVILWRQENQVVIVGVCARLLLYSHAHWKNLQKI